MRKLFTLIFVVSLWSSISWAQVSLSGFSSGSGTYTPITGGVLLGTIANDDERFVDPAVPAGGSTTTGPGFSIGFNFTFNGIVFDRVAVNSNGWISLGQSSLTPSVNNSSSSGYTPISSTTTITPDNLVCRIAALAGDLQGQTGSELRIETVGTSPNLEFVVQWSGYKRYGSTGTGDIYNFQIRLVQTTNMVKFVYGAMTNNATSGTFQVGLRGTPSSVATNFSNRTTTTNWAATIAGTSNDASCTISNTIVPASGLTFTFSPPLPCTTPLDQPTNLVLTPGLTSVSGAFTAISGVDGYLVVRSLSNSLSGNPVNGTSYAVGTPLGGGFVDYSGSGSTFANNALAAGTTYYYYVFSMNYLCTGGAPFYNISLPLTGNTTTLSPGSISSTAIGGPWSVGTTWSGGVVPTATDNAIIVSGATVTVDAATNTCFNLTINSGGVVDVTGTTNKLTVNQDLTNNGTLDLYNTLGTAYCDLTFMGLPNAAFSGTGAVTDINTLTINKGTGTVSLSSPVLEIMPTNLTVKNGSAITGFLQTGTFNGIVKFSGTYTMANPVFLTAAYSIPSTGGFWLNNANFSVTGQNGSPSVSGLFRMNNGTYNVGTVAGNSMTLASGSKIYIEGGAFNSTGRLNVSSASNVISYSQSGGTITVCKVGNTSSTFASFDLGTGLSAISLTGGTIIIQLAGTATSGPRDFRGPTTSQFYANMNTALQLGNALSGSVKTFYLTGSIPPLTISTTSAIHKIALSGSVYYYGSLTIPASSDLNLNGSGFFLLGADLINNGSITGTVTGSRFDFANALYGPTQAQSYSGAGTFGTAVAPIAGTGVSFNNAHANGVTLNAPINTLRTNLFRGSVNNSNNIIFGNGTTGANVVQIGVGGATAPGGTFMQAPVFTNIGSGTYSLIYAQETLPRNTGLEMTPSRLITSLTISNTFGLAITGGNVTLGRGGILTLTAGNITTSAGNLLILTNTATGAVSGGSATSYINGPLQRSLPASLASGSTYLFPIGKGSYNPLELVNPTTNA